RLTGDAEAEIHLIGAAFYAVVGHPEQGVGGSSGGSLDAAGRTGRDRRDRQILLAVGRYGANRRARTQCGLYRGDKSRGSGVVLIEGGGGGGCAIQRDRQGLRGAAEIRAI